MQASATKDFYANLARTQMKPKPRSAYSKGVPSQVQITTDGVHIKKWGDDRFEDQLFEGELAFVFRAAASDVALTVLNLRLVNLLLRDFYNKTTHMVREALNTGSGIAGHFTHEQLADLMKLPTSAWGANPQYRKAVTSQTSEAARSLAYLNLNDVKRMWQFYGTFLGQMVDTKLTKVTTFVRAGVVREMVNVWGQDAAPSSNLYLVWRRLRDVATGEWGPYAIVPYAGSARPEVSDITFEDVGGPPGSVAHGIIEQIGTVLWHTPQSNHPSNAVYNYREDAGTSPASHSKTFTGPSKYTMRVVLGRRRGHRCGVML